MGTDADGHVANERFRESVEASFARQGLMQALGGRLRRIEPGAVEIELPYSELVTQQHGYFHAAAIAAIADNAGGYAALTLMRSNEEVVAAEFKINFLRPAVGRLLVADAVVVRIGHTLAVSQATVRA
ncbi:MAG TPA: PaaI family thioesterase, partial [Vicinamibacterales bacterium]